MAGSCLTNHSACYPCFTEKALQCGGGGKSPTQRVAGPGMHIPAGTMLRPTFLRAGAAPNQTKRQASRGRAEWSRSAGLPRVLEGSPELCPEGRGGERPHRPRAVSGPPLLSAGKEEPLRKWSILICLFSQ